MLCPVPLRPDVPEENLPCAGHFRPDRGALPPPAVPQRDPVHEDLHHAAVHPGLMTARPMQFPVKDEMLFCLPVPPAVAAVRAAQAVPVEAEAVQEYDQEEVLRCRLHRRQHPLRRQPDLPVPVRPAQLPAPSVSDPHPFLFHRDPCHSVCTRLCNISPSRQY